MHNIQVIKRPIYINKPEFDCSLRNYNTKINPNETFHLYAIKKTRGTCVDGVMKNEKCYHVILDLEYLEDFKRIHNTKSRYTLDDIVKDIFGDKDVVTKGSEGSETVIFSHRNLFGHGCDAMFDPYDPSNTYAFDCYMLEDFVECNKTSKELEKIKQEEQRKKTETFNTAMLLDTVITTLKEAGIETRKTKNSWKYKGRSYVCISDKKCWNKLILLAINNYLNDIAKQNGFVIKQPKFMANANITYESPLFFIDEIELLNQEQNN